jgi:phosphoribosylformylglycinamidine synthase
VRLQSVNGVCIWNSKKEIQLPIAHSMGRYITSENEMKRLQDQGQIWLKYENNPNGSMNSVAGISNQAGNVAALMPHPERAIAAWMGSADGRNILSAPFENRM